MKKEEASSWLTRLDAQTENLMEEFRCRWVQYYECTCVGSSAPCKHEEKFNAARNSLRFRIRELVKEARREQTETLLDIARMEL